MKPAKAAAFLCVLMALPLAGACAASPYGDFSRVPDRESCTVDLALPNMACSEACPIKVRSALSGVAGVQQVDVDYDSKSATVEAVYPACSSDGFEEMMARLYARGYRARVVSARSGFTQPVP